MVAPPEPSLVGRDRDVERLAALVSGIARGSHVVVVRGEAGIGKTSLWRWALQRGRAAGAGTLVTRATEEELSGPIVALVDLFDGIAGCEDTLAADIDLFERGRRVLAAVRRLSSISPLVVAIDDVQWLDPVSAGALRYAFRRLDREPVLVLATERLDPSRPPDDRTLPADRREELLLGPLPIDEIRRVIGSLVHTLPRPALERIYELSGGNPMYAIELARAVDRFDDSLVASVPPTLVAALASRLAGGPAGLRHVLGVTAALGPSTVSTIARASGDPDAVRWITEAIDQGLLAVGDDLVVRFTHPLLASAVLAALNPLQRQALHAGLAEVVGDPDARARHLALSCDGPDSDVAAELQAAAGRAARRGASALAADFAGHSVRVTPSTDPAARLRRAFTAVSYRAAAGDKATALAEADRLVAMAPRGPVRAEAIAVRVSIDFDGGDRFLETAAGEAGGDEGLLARILELRGWLAVMHRAELQRGEQFAAEAHSIALRIGDSQTEMLASSTLATAGLLQGRPRPDHMERALHLAATTASPRLGRTPEGVHGRHCVWSGRLAEARVIMREAYDECVRTGAEFQRPFRILDLANLEVAVGHLTEATELAEEGMEAAGDAGNRQAQAWLAYPHGVAQAHLGHADRASDAAALLRSRVAEQDGRVRLVMAGHVLGLVALAAGRPAQAVAELSPAVDLAREIGVKLPSVVPVLPDLVEATALVGDSCSCAELAAELNEQAAAVGQPWVDAAALRGRGLAALAAGDDAAADLLAGAGAAFETLGCRMDAARAMLLHGRALRRSGRRNLSADVLVAAHERFAALGAEPWAAQATVELDRVAPGREQAELTPTEARVARLVVAGLRNREIAGELFVSVATVEAHLTRMYRKLHVRSRTELARVLH